MNHRAVLTLQERRGSLHFPPRMLCSNNGAMCFTSLANERGPLLLPEYSLHFACQRIIGDESTLAGVENICYAEYGEVRDMHPSSMLPASGTLLEQCR